MVILIAVAVMALLSWFIFDKRIRQNHGESVPSGYKMTEEIFIDPVDGKKYRVYYDPDTGSRFYREENKPRPPVV